LLSKEDRTALFLGVATAVTTIGLWLCAYLGAPVDGNQGPVYKIIFIHVPAAAAALILAGGGLLISSIYCLAKTEERALRASRAWAEVGLLFTCLTLATGSIWGKPTWGTWWTWDARLTTTFLFAVLLAAYLMLHSSLSAGKQRIRVCGVLGIIISVDVPIIYKSVEWWRTLHQPASLIESRGRTMDSDMLTYLLASLVMTLVTTGVFWWLRKRNLDLMAIVEQESLAEIRG
jgi:heme exporter protein C